MAKDFVTIATFLTLPEAEAARLHLETEGVPAILADAEIVSMDWLLGNAVGNIKLRVPISRVDAARQLLDEIEAKREQRRDQESSDPDLPDDRCLACGAEMAEDADVCPECGWTWTGAAT